MKVKFWGDPKLVAATVIKAVTDEYPEFDVLWTPCDVRMWRGKLINWYVVKHTDGSFGFNHPIKSSYPRPWAELFADAGALCDAAGVEWKDMQEGASDAN